MNPEYSPADSMLSTPCENYQSLFGEEATASPADLALTPQSMKSDREDSVMSMSQEGADTPQKKPTKKRKSWGQELPTPTTNLGPRKRAKTPAEKEQRRIERVLRNRAAAQTSRERKRLEVDQLEAEKQVTEDRNRFLEDQNRELLAKISMMAEQMTVFQKLVGGEQPTADIRSQDPPKTLSTDLLRSRSNSRSTIKQEPEELDLSFPFRQATVDPRGTALSSPSTTPKLGPTTSTPNMTQHPAEVLCDLPCQLGVSRPWDPTRMDEESLRQWMILSLIMFNMHLLYLKALSIASSTLVLPLSQIFHSLRTGTPLNLECPAATHFAPLISWLISTPTNPLKPATDNQSSTNNSSHSVQPTFRINLLRRLLACSPALARFSQDATGRVLPPISSSDLNRLGRATGGESVDDDRLRLLAMISRVVGSVQGSTRSPGRSKGSNGRPVTHGDPAGDVRRACQRLDELLGGGRSSDGIENGVFRRTGKASFVTALSGKE
ncbi:MAG: hypothetical protein M1812_002549 [Candelaria pacifica]|nr:MAG: hypothetical protein M1812_002549 [Candelaria pacifica]